MAFTRAAALLHAALSDRTATDHHTATVASDLNLADLAARAHSNLSDAPTDAHHSGAHTPESHTNQGATAVELETLTDDSDADALHTHPIHARVKTGNYTGDGALSQAITGIGFKPVYVRVWEENAQGVAIVISETTDTLVDNNAAGFAANFADFNGVGNFYQFNKIISLDADGFTVDDAGADAAPNTNSQVYSFLAIGP